MGLSTAERNRRKRERKKKNRAEQKKREEAPEQADGDGSDAPRSTNARTDDDPDVEIEYVVESVKVPADPAPVDDKEMEELPSTDNLSDMAQVLQRYQERALAATGTVTDDETDQSDEAAARQNRDSDNADLDEDDSDTNSYSNQQISKRKWRQLVRPTVAELKRRVQRPDLVEAHDVTAADPDFLIELKSVPGTVPVPRHWGRKRKYLQGKRGYEKPPFRLPDFILKTGIAEIRDTLAEEEADMSAKQKNRSRVAPKMGAMDVDYRILHEAFFKHQTKPTTLTGFGDLYYEGKELETSTDIKPGTALSKALREALGMIDDTSPPPYLLNMQRYGPPPSYPNLRIPGLNAPLPNDKCQYGFHPGGWGKPPMDAYGNPAYGGNPLDPPGSEQRTESKAPLVTSSGGTLIQDYWGGLPLGDSASPGGDTSGDDDSGTAEDSSDESDGMDESVNTEGSEEGGDEYDSRHGPGKSISGQPVANAAISLRKDIRGGDETPAGESLKPTKQLYTVLAERNPDQDASDSAMFKSQVAYVLPTESGKSSRGTDDSKPALQKETAKPTKDKRLRDGDEYEEDLGKDFKF